MKLQNPFPLRVRALYLYVYSCAMCDRSDRGLELHHIIGRSSCSAFNAIPICTYCHSHIKHTVEEQEFLFNLNLKFLIKENYEPIEEDWDFIKINHKLIGL